MDLEKKGAVNISIHDSQKSFNIINSVSTINCASISSREWYQALSTFTKEVFFSLDREELNSNLRLLSQEKPMRLFVSFMLNLSSSMLDTNGSIIHMFTCLGSSSLG